MLSGWSGHIIMHCSELDRNKAETILRCSMRVPEFYLYSVSRTPDMESLPLAEQTLQPTGKALQERTHLFH